MVLKQILTSIVRNFVPPPTYNTLANFHDVWEECTASKDKKSKREAEDLFHLRFYIGYQTVLSQFEVEVIVCMN